MENKDLINEFDFGLYPKKLWVIRGSSPLVIRESFLDEQGEELSENAPDMDICDAFAMRVIHRESLEFGYVVFFNKKISVKTCAHEAFHVADMLSDDIGVDIYPQSNNEHFAYLLGWITEKIWSVNTKKR